MLSAAGIAAGFSSDFSAAFFSTFARFFHCGPYFGYFSTAEKTPFVNATTWPVVTSQFRCCSNSGSSVGNSDLSQQGCSATNFAARASSGIACSASNALYSRPETNSGPRASFARKKWSLRWWNAPRSAKHMPAGARRSAWIASFTAQTSGFTGDFCATSAVIIRCFGRSRSDGRIVRLNSPSACSRVICAAPSTSAWPFAKKTVFFVAPLRHSSIASGSRTISMCARYWSSDRSGYFVRIISFTVALNSWMFGGPRRTPESPHFATQLKLPFGGSQSITFAS